MRKYVIIAIMFFASLNARYLVRVQVNGYSDVEKLVSQGVDIAASLPTKNAVDVIVKDLDVLSGYSYTILDANLENRAPKRDFGPYYTYAEAVAELDSLHAHYPNIVSEKFSIGQSIEGRELWVARISDNPEADEAEPTVFLNSAIHAREPGAVSTVFGFVHYLVRNYGTDPLVTWLIDNRELYIEPVVNPDGYTYNEISDGYWRKNKRDNNNNGHFDPDYDGVDLNRNFGYMWGYDNTGSSPNPSSQTYRGAGPFSEPETDYMRVFADSIRPRIVINYHTYSNLVIYPWGYVDEPTPDQNTFVAMAQRMTRVNGYEYGRPAELLYPVNGESNDWFYGDTVQKPRALSFVVEVGEAFWQPDTNIILGQIRENIPLNMFVLEAAGLFFEVKVDSIRNQNGQGQINPLDTVSVYLSLTNLSPYETGNHVEITAEIDTLAGTILTPSVSVGSVPAFPAPGVSSASPITIALSNRVRNGTAIEVSFTIRADNDFEQPYRTIIRIGTPEEFITENFEQGLTDWNLTGSWGLTSQHYHSPFHSLTDSPNGEYSNNVDSYAEYAHPIVLDSITTAGITYYTRYEIEDGYDFAYFEISRDHVNWQTLRSYTDTQSAWIADTVDLSDYIGDTVYIRFHFTSDYSVTYDGFYVDDVKLFGYRAVAVAVKPEVKNLNFSLHGNILTNVSHGKLELSLPTPMNISMSVFDVSGRRIHRRNLGMLTSGKYEIPLCNVYSPGLYFVVIKAGEKIYKMRFIVTGR